jgi:Acetyltransferase (GNAT) family.
MEIETYELTEAGFLAGPGGDEADLDIDDIFAKSFAEVVDDWSWDSFGEPGHGRELEALVVGNPLEPQDFVDFVIATVPDPASGVAAIRDGKIVGLYVGSDLVVHPDHREQGIGRALVVERFCRFGDLPTWHLDTPAYSRAGLATHRSAFHSLVQALRSREPQPSSQPDLSP